MKALARLMKTAAQYYCLLSVAVMILLRTLSVAEISSETGLHSEGTVGFEMVGDLFVNLAFEIFRKAG